jgi:hypothetical protein
LLICRSLSLSSDCGVYSPAAPFAELVSTRAVTGRAALLVAEIDSVNI